MKNRIIRILPVLILILITAGSAAAQTILTTESAWINPVYADFVTEDDLAAPRQMMFLRVFSSGTQNDPVTSEEELVQRLREGMKAFSPTVTVYFYTNEIYTSTGNGGDILYRAMAHTGVPNEGDYLYYNITGCRYSFTVNPGNSEFKYKITVTYTMSWLHNSSQEAQVTAAVNEMFASFNFDGCSDIAKVRMIYDYVIGHTEYDYENLNDKTYLLKHSTYSAAVQHITVCQGYSTLMYRLLLMSGIDARVIISATHAWNIARIDGTYYQLDATWGDSDSQVQRDRYFMKSDSSWTDSSHVPQATFVTEDFSSEFPISESDYVEPEALTVLDLSQNPVGNSLSVDLLDSEMSFTTSVLPETARQNAVWEIADETVAVLNCDEAGLACTVEFLQAGDTVITVMSASDTDVQETFDLHIESSQPAQNLFLSENQLEYDIYETQSVLISAYAEPAGAYQQFSWSVQGSAVTLETLTNGSGAMLSFTEAGQALVTVETVDGSGLQQSLRVTLTADHDLGISGPDTVIGGSRTQFTVVSSINPDQITWSVSPESAGSFDANGVFTAAAVESSAEATLSMTCVIGGKTLHASRSVTVKPAPVSVTITNQYGLTMESTRLLVGEERTYSAEVFPSDAAQDVVWSVSAPGILSVDENGTVTGLKAGEAKLTASTPDGRVSASLSISLIRPITSLWLDGPNGESSGELTVVAGTSFKLTPRYSPSNATDPQLTWSVVSGQGLAALSGSYVVTSAPAFMNSAQTVVVRIKAYDGSGLSSDFSFRVLPLAQELTLLDADGTEVPDTSEERIVMDFQQGNKMQFSAVVEPADALQSVKWTATLNGKSSSYVSVSSDGLLTVNKKTAANSVIRLTATTTDGTKLSRIIQIIVKPQASSVKILGSDDTVLTATQVIRFNDINTVQLSAAISPIEAAQAVTWKSSNTNIATVSSDGLVTFLKAGTVTVTATAADGTKKSASVKITAKTYVEEIVLTAPESITAGQSKSVKAVVYPANVSNSTLNWTVTLDDGVKTSLAAVSADGKITVNKKMGACVLVVTAAAADKSGVSASITIPVIPLATSVTIGDAEGNPLGSTVYHRMNGGVQTFQLTAMVGPETTSQTVTWKSSDTKIATVSQEGLVTFKKAGTVTVTATAADGSKTAKTVKIIARILAEEITVTGPETLTAGKSGTLSYTLLPANTTVKTVSWSFLFNGEPTSLASVSSNKLTLSKKTGAGTLTVCATAADGSQTYGEWNVTVIPLANSVTIEDSEGNPLGSTVYHRMNEGNQSYQLTAAVSPERASQAVTWKSSDTKIATVSKEGLVTFKKAGAVTVTATAADGSKIAKTVKIIARIFAEEVTVNGPESLTAGKSGTLTCTVLPANTTVKTVSWSFLFNGEPTSLVSFSSNKLTLSKKLGAGTLTVRATSSDGSQAYGEWNINVIPLAAAVVIGDAAGNPMDTSMRLELNEGVTLSLSASVSPAEAGQLVKWTSSDTKIATVDADGTVTFKKAGTVTVTVTARDGSAKTDTLKITAKRWVTGITLSGPEVIRPGKSGTVTFAVQPANATGKTVNWSVMLDGKSSSLVSVSSGKVTVNKKVPVGSEILVTAKAADGSGITATFLIYVGEKPEDDPVTIVTPGGAGDDDVTFGDLANSYVMPEVTADAPDEAVVIASVTPVPTSVPDEADEIPAVSSEETAAGVNSAEPAVIDFTEPEVKMRVKETRLLAAGILDSDTGFFFGSGDSEILAVDDGSGLVTALRSGETVLYLSSADPVEVVGLVHVTVTEETTEETTSSVSEEPVSTEEFALAEQVVVDFSEPELEMEVNDVAQMQYGTDAEGIFYGSNDPNIAEVDSQTGLVTALRVGETMLYAASSDPLEVKALIHLTVSAVGTEIQVETQEHEVSAEISPTSDPETVTETPESALIQETVTETPTPEIPCETDEPLAEISETEDPESETPEVVNTETAVDTVPEIGETPVPDSEEAKNPSAEPALTIRDLTYDGLRAYAGSRIGIDAERLELTDAALSDLVFVIADESVAVVVPPDEGELMEYGITLDLLNPGETVLQIRLEDGRILLEVPVHSEAQPIPEETKTPEPEPVIEVIEPIETEQVIEISETLEESSSPDVVLETVEDAPDIEMTEEEPIIEELPEPDGEDAGSEESDSE